MTDGALPQATRNIRVLTLWTLPVGYIAVMAARVQDALPEYVLRRRRRIARVLVVVGIAGMLVIPALICIRGWHHAETARGYGEGAGVFTVAACGDPTKETSTDSDGNQTTDTRYTCTGAFARQMYVADAAVYAYSDYPAGVQKPAYLVSDGGVVLGSDEDAMAMMAIWAVGAYGAVCLEVVIIWLAACVIYREFELPDEPGSWLLGAVCGAFVLAVLVCLFLDVLYDYVH